jgi:uncharacterized protein
MKRLLLFATLLIISLASFSQVPKYLGWVSDHEKIFTQEQNRVLSNTLSNYEKQTTIEIKVLTIAEYEGDIFDFAQETAETWGVGKKDIDNGLLIVLLKNNRILRSQTGYGLEGYLPDGWLKHVGDSITKADLKNGEYYKGVTSFVEKCKERIGKEGYSEEHNEELIKENEDSSILKWLIEHVPWYVWILIVVGWIILFFICPDCALILLYIVTAGKGGGGGSSGGGGKFGGGGSSSSW